MKKSVVVLETLEEATYFTKFLLKKEEKFRDCSVLSFQPDIQAHLLKYDIKSISSAEITNALSYAKVMDQCEELENCIHQYIERNAVERPEEYFINAYFYYLRCIGCHLLWNIEVLDSLLSSRSYTKLFAFTGNRYTTLSPWIATEQLFVGELAKQMCKTMDIEFVSFHIPSKPVKKFIKEFPNNSYVKICNRISFCLLKTLTSFFSKEKYLLVQNFTYNIDMVCDELVKNYKKLKICSLYEGKTGISEVAIALAVIFHVMLKKKIKKHPKSYPLDFALPIMTFARYYDHMYDDSTQRRYINSTMRALESGEKNIMTFKGVNIFKSMKQKVMDDLLPFMLRLNFQVFGLEKCLSLFRPDYVLSQTNYGMNFSLGTITKNLNIPSVLISHGSHVYHQNKYAARDHKILARNILVGDYNYCAVQSPLARKMALHLTDDPQRVINIRPTVWGREVNSNREKRSNRLTIVHAGTFKRRHVRRYIYETSDEMVQELKNLCEAVSEKSNLKLIIKFRPDRELSIETLNSLLPLSDNIVIKSEGPFGEVLKETDLLVSFSSTTIEEALVNKVPVLLYGGHGRYSHIPVKPFPETDGDIAKSVTFVRDKHELRKYLAALDQLEDGFRVPDEEFRPYCFEDDAMVDFSNWFLGLGCTAD